jgi:hypothetical protein
MSKITSNEVVSWHRDEAKKFEQRAKKHNEIADLIESEEAKERNQEESHFERAINAQQLEEAVRERTGRIANLADRLQTSAKAIEALLEPKSKVFVGQRGWLAVRE